MQKVQNGKCCCNNREPVLNFTSLLLYKQALLCKLVDKTQS